jgi:SET domain-containing protein
MRRITARNSPVHGRGVFALTAITVGESILQYRGKLLSWKEAQHEHARSGAQVGHTFFFDLDDGYVIDGGQGGNSARWLNHSCAPNCEAQQEGRRIFIVALRAIKQGDELFIDYQLGVQGDRSAAVKRMYACHCVSKRCRGTMLATRN